MIEIIKFYSESQSYGKFVLRASNLLSMCFNISLCSRTVCQATEVIKLVEIYA